MPGPGSYWIGEEERQEALEVLDKNSLFRYGDLDDLAFTHKAYTLEQDFAAYCGANHVLATSSGTCSLLISLLALGLKPGDEVIVPAYTFVASYTSIIFAGLVPVLAEIDESLTIDPNSIEKKITPKTRAIMPVHMLGNPCDMTAIMQIAKEHGLLVIEDACQAAGGVYQDKKLGTIGDMGAFSLNVFKTITCGDGGMVATNDRELYERAFGFHDQGHTPNRAGLEVGNRTILGLNFRITELAAAVALAQLRKLDDITRTLREKKTKLKQAISQVDGVKFRTLNDTDGECGTLCTVLFDSAERATEVAQKLGTKTIDQSGWHVYANMEHIGKHLEEIGQPYGRGAHPTTDDILSRAINLSVGVVDGGLGAGFGINIMSTDEEIESVARQFQEAC